jgi:adenosylmethionine-8-amino-7-oxononanoate aminotransferase
MKDYETFKPPVIEKAKGSYLYTNAGQKIIDAISSWWCKTLGHNHPKLNKALIKQTKRFEHVILANTTNETIVQLAEELSKLTKSLNKIMFASDGSCAMEIAMKMSLHAHQITGELNRTKFACLKNGYHGETCLTMAVSDCELYKKPYQSILPHTYVISSLPYTNSKHTPLWKNCEQHWQKIEIQLNKYKDQLTAITFEPILQGAGGMLIYSADFLCRLRKWTEANNIHLIADEIMTGFGRTGLPLACQHAKIEPDFLCLAKGLTAGYLPMSVVLTNQKIYDYFYDDYETGKAFLHSHTHSGNALAAAVALETLKVIQQEHIYAQVQIMEPILYQYMQEVAAQTKKLKNIRYIGAVVAADLITDKDRMGYQIFQQAIKLGALLRPIGNTIYWLPPLNIKTKDLRKLRDITIKAIDKIRYKSLR